MKNLLLWVMMACLSIVLALSACQMEQSQEILEQPTSAFSGEGSSGPEVPEGVSFVDIEIPEEYLFTGSGVEIGTFTYSVQVLNVEGDTLDGFVILEAPLEVGEDPKLVSLLVSSSLADKLGIEKGAWVEYSEARPAGGRLDCSLCFDMPDRRMKWGCYFTCVWDNIGSGTTAFIDGVSKALD